MAATQQVKQGSVVLFILRTALEGPSRALTGRHCRGLSSLEVALKTEGMA